jgi:hypothetical protein
MTLAFRVPVWAAVRDMPVVPICRNPMSLISTAIHLHLSPHPVPLEGRFAIVTNVGRDATDASGAADESAGPRLLNGRDSARRHY